MTARIAGPKCLELKSSSKENAPNELVDSHRLQISEDFIVYPNPDQLPLFSFTVVLVFFPGLEDPSFR